MNVTSFSPAISTYLPASNTTVATTKSSTAPDSAFPLVTADDIAIEERIYGKSDLAALEAVPNIRMDLSCINGDRVNGNIQGSLAKYKPVANLTDADMAFFEKLTGTTNILAATASSYNALALISAVAYSRQDGSLTGNLTPDSLNSYLATSQEASTLFQTTGLASPAFVKEAIAALEATSVNASTPTVNAVV